MDGAGTTPAADGLARDADREIGRCRLALFACGERVAKLVSLGGGIVMPEEF